MSRPSAEQGKSAKKQRTAMSCDRCKSRKTKCTNPVPGPCDYCQSIGVPCHIDAAKRKQRPYYFVSEEEFRHMSKIIKHCFPDRSLDLSDLRALSEELDSKHGDGSGARSVGSASLSPPKPDPGNTQRTNGTAGTAPPRQHTGLVLEEIAALHEDLGCLMKDSRGEYRYIGADAGISFNAAVRHLEPGRLAAKLDKDLIPGMKTTALPPATSESSPGAPVHPTEIQLPSRYAASEYVNRFFEEVHCLYWLYPTESFQSRLANTYSNRERMTASWLCSLYALFSIGAQRSTNLGQTFDSRTSYDYLLMAKSLVSRVCDEADLDSIRAHILLALALQSHCFSNTAYLLTGIACRIAFSLGLHVDKYAPNHDAIEKDHARRLYYTLYIFDQEVALRCGKPCAIAPYSTSWEPQPPSESPSHAGNALSGYLEVSRRLTQLTKTTCQTLYIEPMSGQTKLLSPKVAAILSSLQQWANSVPPHLSRTTQVTASHKRAIALLHVRYLSVIILATRPFLLCNLVKRDFLRDPQKKKCYDELSNICLDAAAHSLDVLQMLARERLLSSLLPSIFNYVLELVQLFLVAFAREHSEQFIQNIRACVQVFESMDNVGWTARARPEVMSQLREYGILAIQGDTEPLPIAQNFSGFSDGPQNNIDMYDLVFGTDQGDASGLGYTSMAFNDLDFGDPAASEEIYQQIMDNGRMPHFVSP